MKTRKVAGRRAGDRRRTVELGFDRFENRLLLTGATVTNTNASGAGSLANAIDISNSTPPAAGTNVITFDIPGTGPFVINTSTALLPQIAVPTTIDGTSQPGYSGTPLIEIDGGGLSGDGLSLAGSSDGSTIEGLDIVNFADGAGIHIIGLANDLIIGNFIGVDPTGAAAGPGNAEGVWLDGSSGDTIGGTTAAAANVIGFNQAGQGAGVYITGTANSNLIQGNFIGTNSAGGDLPNKYGVDVAGGAGNVIGGTVSAAANVVGFNSTVGIEISGATATTVEGNSIGTDTGGANLGNAVGVEMDSATGSTIGGTVAGVGNIIADNTTAFVVNSGSGNSYRENLIYGNGAPFATTSLPSVPAAPTILGVASVASLTTIDYSITGTVGQAYSVDFYASNGLGGPAAEFLETVTTPALTSTTQSFTTSYNPGQPPLTSSQAVTAMVTDPNNNTSFFATAVAPSSPFVVTNTDDNVPGSAVGSLRQAILDANQTPGSTITFDITGLGPFVIETVTALPTIGVNTSIDGTTQPGYNGTPLVELNGDGELDVGLTLGVGDDVSTIEGLDIVNYGDAGIEVQGNADLIAGNFLGTDLSGTSAGPGDFVGVLVQGAGNTIGGTTAAAANVFGFETTAPGVGVYLSGGNGNLVEGNFIGTNAQGADLGNSVGIYVSTASGSTIGGTTTAAANVFGFNSSEAIFLLAATATLIDGNFIGTDAAGDHLDNALGVEMVSGTVGTTIGGTAAGAGNTIAYNTGDAVDVASGSGNAIRGNRIFGNTAAIVLAAGANNNQAAPSNLALSSVPGTTTIDYTVTGTPGDAYSIDFFASDDLGGPAGQYLGTVTTPALSSATQSFTATLGLSTAIASDQTVTATATDPSNDTSAFATAVAPAPPYLVSNTNDSGIGSLRQAILDANASPPSSGRTDAITFDIPGTGPFVISPASLLPSIDVPVTLDGTSQPGFYPADQPLIEIDGQGQNGDGLVLSTGSNGSTVQAVDVADFGGSGIHIESSDDAVLGCDLGTDPTGTIAGPGNGVGIFIDQSSGDTIGGTAAAAANTIGFNSAAGVSVTGGTSDAILGNFIGTDPAGVSAGNGVGILINGSSSGNSIGGAGSGAGNTIADNGGDAVEIAGDAGNLIRRNLIYGNGSGIVETQPTSSVPAPPSALAVTSIPGRTTIDYAVTGTSSETDTVDFFASDGAGGPAAEYLGSATASLSFTGTTGTEGFTATFSLAQPLLSGQLVTATVTGPDLATSTFAATAVAPASPFVVTNEADGQPGAAVGSLRQAIVDADASPPTAGQTDDIVFDISGTGPFSIALMSSLPAITVPVTIDATKQTGYAGTPLVAIVGEVASVPEGLVLSAGSGGSTIEGLAIAGFAGAGIQLESPDDLVVADDLGTLVQVPLSGPGNQIGVWIDNAANETIGGTAAASANVIGLSSSAGVSISGSSAQGEVVSGNFIGTDAAGDDLSNGVGVAINGSSNDTIGGTATAANGTPVSGNTIGNDASGGIEILSGTGDAVRENTYIGTNGSTTQPSLAANDIVLSAGANANQPAPVLVSASLAGGQLLVGFTDAVPAGTVVTLDIYEYSVGTTPSLDRRTFLGTASATMAGTTASVTIATSAITTAGELVATATSAQDTSAFSAPLPVTPPILVTNTGDNGQNPAPNSLRWAILQAENTSGASIAFDIPNTDPGFRDGTYIITLTSALPAITVPMTIAGESQPGFNPSFPLPVIEIDAGGTPAGSDGLVLGPGSGGSTVQGLDIVSASGAGLHIESGHNLVVGDVIGLDTSGTLAATGNATGILIGNAAGNTIGGTTAALADTIDNSTGAGVSISGAASQGNLVEGDLIGISPTNPNAALGNGLGVVIAGGSNNTIGGTVAGAGNTITDNAGAAVTVQTGTGNAIRENPILNNGSGILLENGGNDGAAAPTLAGVKYQGSDVIVTLSTAMPAGTILDFFASEQPVAPDGPIEAQVFLGASQPTTAGQTIFSLPTPALAGNQDLIATATLAGGDTSEFSNTATVSNPFSVTNTNDDGEGSLRAALAAATGLPAPTITFNIPAGPYVIDLQSPLTITSPVFLDAGSQPGFLSAPVIVLNGGDTVAEGLVLDASGSTIEGLSVVGFTSVGIDVESNDNTLLANGIGATGDGNAVGLQINGLDNTIGGTVAGTGNTITGNTGAAVSLLSGTGNAIRGNLIYANAPGHPPEDGIVLGPDATGVQAAPTLSRAQSDAGQTIVDGTVSGYAPDATFDLDFYSYAPGQAPAQNYLGSFQITTDSSGDASFSAPVSGFSSGGLSITATSTGPEPTDSTGGPGNDTTSTFSGQVRVTVVSAYAVTNLSDDADTPGSLPYEIDAVNGAPSTSRSAPDVITFAIQVSGPLVIDVTSSVPMTVTVPVTIDATSQVQWNGAPVIELDGEGNGLDGLVFGDGSVGSTVEGLDFVGFGGQTSPGAAIDVGSSDVRVYGDTFDDDRVGVLIDDGAANTVGGFPGYENTIGGAIAAGVSITGSSATGNVVSDNFIGTDATGLTNLGSGEGIVIDGGASGNTIGGSGVADANVIAFNGTGILISGPLTAANVVAHNFIGTDAANVTMTGNAVGVDIGDGAAGNLIGGVGLGNTIGGNTSTGVSIGGTPGAPPTAGNVVSGNFIGVSADGVELSNGDGVAIADAFNNMIGGTVTGAGNTIADNAGYAVDVASGSGDAIRRNLIYGNTAGSIAIASGANGGEQAPASLAVSSVPSLTTIDFQVTTSTAGTGDYTVEFFASSAVGSPASVFLGTTIVDLTAAGTQSFTTTLGLSTALAGGQLITATVTDPDGDTSPLAVSVRLTPQFEVTNATDEQPGSEVGSLRQVIANANTSPPTSGTDDITFQISGSTVINLSAALPAIVVPVTIDGTTQAGVEIDGRNQSFDGLTLGTGTAQATSSAGSTIEGIEILDFGENGLVVQTASNTIGGPTAAAGDTIFGNQQDGVLIQSSGNLMQRDVVVGNGVVGSSVRYNGIDIQQGTSNTVEGGVISGNTGDGILIEGAASLTRVEGSRIGTDPTGNAAAANGADGIGIQGFSNTIGGASSSVANTISGNANDGISIFGDDATKNHVEGNFIGTNGAGTASLSNGGNGVEVQTPANTIGGSLGGALSTPGASLGGDRNIISGNGAAGVLIETTGIAVENNAIGTTFDGNGSAMTQQNGVVVGGPPSTLLGLPPAGGVVIQGNLISGNADSGIYLEGNATKEQIEGNFVGTDVTGLDALPNANGVVVADLGGDTIGGTSSVDMNVISGNSGSGISIGATTLAGEKVIGNLIGTAFTGAMLNGNTDGVGITIDSGSNNTIGGVVTGGVGVLSINGSISGFVLGNTNVISGNNSIGIQILRSSASGNMVLGNLIGTDPTGTTALMAPNPTTGLPIGILIDDSPSNTVGGTAQGTEDVIAGFGVGIDISGFDAHSNVVADDRIGAERDGHPIAGSIGIGVYINDVGSNSVGGSTGGAGNVIAGYNTYGIYIYGELASHNVVQGNQIGINRGKTGELAGIAVEDASDNTLGGSSALAGNTISGNSYAGIYIFGQGTTGASDNEMQHNRLQRNGYGILLFNATNNGGYQTLLSRNRYARDGIANVREFVGSVTASGKASSHVAPSKKAKKASHHAAVHSRPARVRHAETSAVLRPGGGAEPGAGDPIATGVPTSAAHGRRVQPGAAIPAGPLAHRTRGRLNHPPSAAGHAGHATGRTAS